MGARLGRRPRTLIGGGTSSRAGSRLAEFVEDGEVLAGQVIGNPALPTVAALGLEPVYEIDDIVEAAARAGADEEGKGAVVCVEHHLLGSRADSVDMKRSPFCRIR
jgi:hypothetical protein